jgi:DNA mismatch repair protein PMS2
MATIKAIEARSVHQIQSGQVIVDLCSVVKELVENSLDAGASAVEVRFKNNGLDSIEVQDNGNGISPANYESIALKHYTSKLSSYEDLSTLQTFGFRGEALSSLCALSNFHITTAQADEAPKGKRLEFEVSGKLKSTTTVASQKGTTASVEGLFEQLPVRRKELAKNIKREYGKVLGLLHAYACISTGVKLTVKNAIPKSKTVTVFATNSNATTKDNIANVYGAKTLSALVPLDLDFEFQPSVTQRGFENTMLSKISIRGHISRPVYGEGRQTPDRQMFFVNARPCGLPQVAKAINEVYKSFNVSQSPFIFADFRMDTNAYDVNVSPDKRTILLHDSATLVEKLKTCLIELFEQQEQTMPQSQLQNVKLTAFKQLTVRREDSADSAGSDRSDGTSVAPGRPPTRNGESGIGQDEVEDEAEPSRFHDFFRNQASSREERTSNEPISNSGKTERAKEKMAKTIAGKLKAAEGIDEYHDGREGASLAPSSHQDIDETMENVRVRDFNDRIAEQQRKPDESKLLTETSEEAAIPDVSPTKQSDQSNLVQNAFDSMRPRRTLAETATITVGDKTVTTIVGSQRPNKVQIEERDSASKRLKRLKTTAKMSPIAQQFSQSLRHFAAPGTQADDGDLPQEQSESEFKTEQADIESRHSSDDSESGIDGEAQPEEHKVDLDGEGGKQTTSNVASDDADSDGDYVDEAEKKAKEEARVADLIRAAEESAAHPSKDNIKRANKVLKCGLFKDSTTTLLTRIDTSVANVEDQINWMQRRSQSLQSNAIAVEDDSVPVGSEEERLSLTVSKDDFASMHIVGQFNLGFILAVRPPASRPSDGACTSKSDELFIIDQHASDEKFNFERLQAETIVNNQRLVRPMVLDLTAVEEEIVIENSLGLEKNGFILDVDTSGDQSVGQRCKLLSLPLSKEVVFDTRDLDELIHLLAESPTVGPDSMVPRPSKVRKMFAMRACRSSIMIGKSLTGKQMSAVVRHMGMIDKPWNCPHGRPTMRHLMSLNAFTVWDERGGSEGLDLSDKTEAEVWRCYGL